MGQVVFADIETVCQLLQGQLFLVVGGNVGKNLPHQLRLLLDLLFRGGGCGEPIDLGQDLDE